jgi:hypothetical protein
MTGKTFTILNKAPLKITMKNLLPFIVLLLLATSLMGQSNDDYIELTREVIKVEKKAGIANLMQLSDEESEPFWTLYNEYQGKLYVVQNKRIKVIKDFVANYQNVTDSKADELWNNYLAFEKELLAVKKAYYKKFKKILPSRKVVQFFQAENKIEKLIDAQLATEIPLIK